MKSSNLVITACVTSTLLGVLTGIIIGYYKRPFFPQSNHTVNINDEVDSIISKLLYDEVSRTHLEENSRILTEEPHIAGSDREEVFLADFVANKWKDAGLDVEVHPYDVLLSYPDEMDPNYVAIVTDEGEEIYESHPMEKILDQSQNKSNVVNPFNAYSPSGNPQGEPVYVNYGRVEDFRYLQNRSINVKGKICIVRYGKLFRADKASHAEEEGCIGMILYSDPKECTVKGKGVYPEEWFLPGTGAQRGTIFLREGDPETPDYPSIESAWRTPADKLFVPKIPVTPISYDDAVQYLGRMSGPEAPEDWIGDLAITYRLGPGFSGVHKNSSLKMHVTNRNERKTTRTITAYIRGNVEPDRYILVGSHRDAWVFGAMDPSSAQSITLELGRVMGKAVKNGWKPRRTIILCSWGAEEYGLLGSTEWVEEFQKNLESRAVVYINLDIAVLGEYSLYAAGVPSLKRFIFDVTKDFPNPDPDEVAKGRTSLYDTWKRRWPADFFSPDSEPFVRQIGSGSDYTAFLQRPGVTVLDFAFAYDIRQDIDFYPTYHSVYETFDYMKKFIDPEFIYHQAMTRLVAEMVRRLTDNVILPINAEDYATSLIEHRDDLNATFGKKMAKHGINFETLVKAVDEFKEAAADLHNRISMLNNNSDPLAIRALNDQLLQLERAFIDCNGVGERTNFKHVIYAPSQQDRYSSTSFPGLVDSMFEIDEDPNQEARWDEVRRQFSILVFHIGSAASTLRDFTPMQGASNPQ